MKPWFIWNNKNSDEMGLWVSKLPKITKAPERYDTIEVPGRAGSLIMLEGENVYDSYVKPISVQTINTNGRLPEIIEWLRGEGELTISTEPDRVYYGRIVAEVSFDRLGNSLLQAQIPFLVEPFKGNRHHRQDRITVMPTIEKAYFANPGNISSRPVVMITGSGNNTISFNGHEMSFTGISGTIIVDCDAQVIAKNGEVWNGSFTGDFWRIEPGECEMIQSGEMKIEIDPNWRWV